MRQTIHERSGAFNDSTLKSKIDNSFEFGSDNSINKMDASIGSDTMVKIENDESWIN